jgi:hypothetical protein
MTTSPPTESGGRRERLTRSIRLRLAAALIALAAGAAALVIAILLVRSVLS